MLKLSDLQFLQVKPGKKLKLKDVSTDSTRLVPDREKADEATKKATEKLGELQDRLYAEGRRSVLAVLQGMDASGKDGTVRKVFDDVNPTGVQVVSFKQPTSEELRHDFLWRCHTKAPPRGTSGFSIGRIMRMCWWCGCMRTNCCRRSCGGASMSGRIGSG